MKKLFIIGMLMFSIAAVGQIVVVRWTGDTIELNDYTLTETMNSGAMIWEDANMHATYSAWLMNQYLEYCHSDSSVWWSQSTAIPGDDPMVDTLVIKNIYKHREPTFKGYAVWLNNTLIQ